jgi:hypothetical protein
VPNLARLLTKTNVRKALHKAFTEDLDLRKGTRYAIVYKGRQFPPKEIARLAVQFDGLPRNKLKNYRLQGGPKALNHWLEELGFKVIQHTIKKVTESSVPLDQSHRIVRLCWNDLGWVRSSGVSGKGKTKGTHEATYGYGHEEWLFDTSKLIDGYHYGFIEPIRKTISAYYNQTFDVRFFTIDGNTKERYWAGRISALEVIDGTEAERVKKIYRAKGWLKEMEDEIKIIQKQKNKVKKKVWSAYHGLNIFNIRFKPISLIANSLYTLMPSENPLHLAPRYSFIIERPKHLTGYPTDNKPFTFLPGDKPLPNLNKGQSLTKKYMREAAPVEMTFMHEEISIGLTRKLWKLYGQECVTRNHPANFLGREIDIVVKDKKHLIFYEIKTFNALIQSIRAALGQLMEYAHWSQSSRSKKWIIVTQAYHDSADGINYLRHIRATYNLPVFYQSYDLKTGDLSKLQ